MGSLLVRCPHLWKRLEMGGGSLHMEGWLLTGAHDFPGPARALLTIFCFEEQNPGPQRKASGTGRVCT